MWHAWDRSLRKETSHSWKKGRKKEKKRVRKLRRESLTRIPVSHADVVSLRCDTKPHKECGGEHEDNSPTGDLNPTGELNSIFSILVHRSNRPVLNDNKAPYLFAKDNTKLDIFNFSVEGIHQQSYLSGDDHQLWDVSTLSRRSKKHQVWISDLWWSTSAQKHFH